MPLDALEPLEIASGWFHMLSLSHEKPDWVGSTLGEVHFSTGEGLAVGQIQRQGRVGRGGQREVDLLTRPGVPDHAFIGQDGRGGRGWSDRIEPTAQHEEHHQANGLCMATPTRHASRWSLKDLKDAPSDFPANRLQRGRRADTVRGLNATSSRK